MKLIGFGVCGPGEADRYMRETMEEFARLCDHTVIVGNNITRAERDLINDYGFELITDNREWGKHQPNIKTDLLKYVQRYKPDWIVPLDMDEVFDKTVDREALERLALKGGIAWNFYIADLWDDIEHYGYAFWNIRFFKNTPEHGLNYLKRGVHCGLAPPMQYKYANDAPHILWHYGLIDRNDRLKKIERYKKYDPTQEKGSGMGSFYEILQEDRPPKRLDREELRNKVAEDVNKRRHMKGVAATINPGDNMFAVMKKDDRQIDVPLKDARRYEKQGWTKVSEIDMNETQPLYQGSSVEVEQDLTCPFCGKECKSVSGLERHKKACA